MGFGLRSLCPQNILIWLPTVPENLRYLISLGKISKMKMQSRRRCNVTLILQIQICKSCLYVLILGTTSASNCTDQAAKLCIDQNG